MKGRCNKCGAKMGGHVCGWVKGEGPTDQKLMDLQRQIAVARMQLDRLKDSIASHKRAEDIAFSRYVDAVAKAAGVGP